jgi:thiol-disulfide isomerase/thioredoxin
VSGDVLFWAVDNVPLEGSKVYDLLADNWAADARIKKFCLRMTQMPHEAAAKLLQKVSEENKDKDIRGLAVFALAVLSKEKSEEKGDVQAAGEAEKLFERVCTEFATVKLPRGPAGEQAKSALREIRKRGVGKKMPNLESEDLQGNKVQLKDHKGKVVVLDIWATWCGPCRAMIPHERDMVEKLKNKPFALISISADAKKETLEQFLKTNKMPWTHWWNGQNGGILQELDVQFFPTIYVLDGEGVIRYKNIRNEQLEEAVEKLLAEAEGKK